MHDHRRAEPGPAVRPTAAAPPAPCSWPGTRYLDSGFSTVTEVVDTATGKGFGNLETYRIVKDGARTAAPDVNFWGVTFATDDTFYATLGHAG